MDEIIEEVDKDGSGEIEFGEFVDLVHKVQTGAIEMGLLAQAIMDSGAGQKLAKEVKLIKKALEDGPPRWKQLSKEEEEANLWNEEEDDEHEEEEAGGNAAGEDSNAGIPHAKAEAQKGEVENALAAAGAEAQEEEESNWVEGLLSLEIERRDATTCTASLLGPESTPYQGHVMVIEIKVWLFFPSFVLSFLFLFLFLCFQVVVPSNRTPSLSFLLSTSQPPYLIYTLSIFCLLYPNRWATTILSRHRCTLPSPTGSSMSTSPLGSTDKPPCERKDT